MAITVPDSYNPIPSGGDLLARALSWVQEQKPPEDPIASFLQANSLPPTPRNILFAQDQLRNQSSTPAAPAAQATPNVAAQPAVAPTPAAPTDPAAFFQQLRQQAGSTAAGGMGGTSFAPAQKSIDELMASIKNAQYTPPAAPSAVKDFEARRAAAGAAPDSEDDKYNPLQGKRLPQFMADLGMRMLAGNNGQSFATNIGSSMLGASAEAKSTAAKKLTEDKDAWKQKLADAQTLVGLGQTDYGNQSAEAKAQFEAAMKRITAQATGVGENVKLAGEKSADAYRRGMLDNTSAKGVAKDRVAQMEQMFQIYKKLTPGVSDKDALKMAVQAIMNPRQDKASEFDTAAQKAMGEQWASAPKSPVDLQLYQGGFRPQGFDAKGAPIWGDEAKAALSRSGSR